MRVEKCKFNENMDTKRGIELKISEQMQMKKIKDVKNDESKQIRKNFKIIERERERMINQI